MEATPLPTRTTVSQRHCRRDPEQLVERTTAAREVGACLKDIVK
jgi:hypothetical protein